MNLSKDLARVVVLLLAPFACALGGARAGFAATTNQPGAASQPTNPVAPAKLAAPATKQELIHTNGTPTTNVLTNQFRLKDGFRLETVAAAPLVSAPVAMCFDEDGRLFVAELLDSRSGRIVLLEDTDGDGTFDTSTVFAEDIPIPTSLVCYGGGVFVASTPDILYLKNASNGGEAVRQTVFSGAGSRTNGLDLPAILHSLAWTLDNRIQGGASGPGLVLSAGAAPNPSPLDAGRYDFSFDPRVLAIAPEAGPAHLGSGFDSLGRKISCGFDGSLRLPVFKPHYRLRNPYFPAPMESVELETLGAPASPPASSARAPTANGQTNVASANKDSAPLANLFLAMRTCAMYRGVAFGAAYLDNLFVADAQAGAVQRWQLREGGLAPSAERSPGEREFLSASPSSFRPLQIITGPNGGLYIADAQNGDKGGRILRIAPKGFKQSKLPQMSQAKTADLVVTLADLDGWRRDCAARLLYERQDKQAVSGLIAMLHNSQRPLARLHALHALDGLGRLHQTNLLRALRDTDARVREHALAMSEATTASDELWAQVKAMAADPSPRVRYQLTLTLGEFQRPEHVGLLAQMLRSDGAIPWVGAAALSSLATNAGALFSLLARDAGFCNNPAGRECLSRLAAMIGVRGAQDDVQQAVDTLDRAPLDADQVLSLLYTLGDGLQHTGSSLALVDPKGRLNRFYDSALAVALSDNAPQWRRLAAIRTLGVSEYSLKSFGDLVLFMFGSAEPPALQSATLAMLGRYREPQMATGIMGRLPTMSAGMRRQAVAALMARAERWPLVLESLQTGKLREADFGPLQISLLLTHRDAAIRQRALQRFGPANPLRPAVLQQYQPSLRLKGSVQRGREIFGSRCALCHVGRDLGALPTVSGPANPRRDYWNGAETGPDLARARSLSKESLLKAILQPSADITPGYETHVVETATGDILVGVLTDLNAITTTFMRPDGTPILLPRSNIAFDDVKPWSLMPEGLEEGLDPQAMADLLDFLRN